MREPVVDSAALASAELGGLVEELIERLKRGEQVDPEYLAEAYPDAAASLVSLLPTIRGLVDLSRAGLAELAEDALAGAGVTAERQLGDYRIVRQIGRGGMGVVYQAEQLSLGRFVALKVLPLAAVLDPRTLQRFKNEAQAAATLDHPHIVDVYGVGCERGVHYYAMRLIDGCTVADVVEELKKQKSGTKDQETRNGGGRPWLDTHSIALLSTLRIGKKPDFYRKVAELGIDVADGLSHAHEQGIVHRDIKPSNLMLDGQGKVWITDFGLAHIEANQSLTMTGDLVGTLRYMSPEQALAKRAPVDHRSDIYSLGATLYELLTLQPVIPGDDRAVLMQRIAFADPVPPRQLNPQIPADLETILLKMLEKHPQSRYASARELSEDLQRFIQDKPIAARRPSFGRRIAKWSQRNRSLVATIALVVLAAAAGVGGMAGWWARAEANQQQIADRAAAGALRAAADHQNRGRWPEALTELRQAQKALAGRVVAPPLRRRLEMQAADAQMVVRLDAIRMTAAALVEGEFDFASADAAYESAFRDYGIETNGVAADACARAINQRAISKELADSLTNWSFVRKRLRSTGESEWRLLLATARQVDPDPWRNRLRGILESHDAEREQLISLARDSALLEQPPSALFLLLQLHSALGVAESLAQAQLREIQDQHAGDFWIQFGLARFFESTQPPQLDEAVRHYSIAVGIRPTAAAAHNNLGAALKKLGKRPEAIAEFRQAINLEPNFALPYANLGLALTEERKFDEAVAALRKSLALRNQLAVVHRNLGSALIGLGIVEEGISAIREAIAREPSAAGYHYDLGNACQSIGEFKEAMEAYRSSIRLNPRDARAHSNLGAMLELYGERAAALAEYELAVTLDPRYFFSRRNLARCLQRLGRFTEGLDELQRGQALEAQNSVAPSRYTELINEARRLVEIDTQLSDPLAGDLDAAHAPDPSRIARVLYYKRRYAEAVPFFVAVSHNESAFAENDRYDAACVAMRAAGSLNQESQNAPISEQARFREQALLWLQSALQSSQQRLRMGTVIDRSAMRRTLSQWLIDPDLASVRDEGAGAGLSSQERVAWDTLWNAVHQLMAELKAG